MQISKLHLISGYELLILPKNLSSPPCALSELEYDKLSQSEINGKKIMKTIKYSRFLDIMKI
jgi:hypothetical protein